MEYQINKIGKEYAFDFWSEDGKYAGNLPVEEIEVTIAEFKAIQAGSNKTCLSQTSGLRTIGYCKACNKPIKTFNKEAVEGVDYHFVDGYLKHIKCNTIKGIKVK